MSVSRDFFYIRENLTPEHVAKIVGGELHKSPSSSKDLTGLSWCEAAGKNDIIFIDNKKYLPSLYESKAACALFSRRLLKFLEGRDMSWIHLIVCDDSRLGFALLGKEVCRPLYHALEGVATSAIIDPSATIGKNVSIGEYSVIREKAVIGDGTSIGHQVVIEAGVIIGENCQIDSQTSIQYAHLGSKVKVGSGTRIGMLGFGMVEASHGFVDMPHVGGVTIGDDVVIGANVVIDRGTLNDTVIEEGSRLGDLVLISHNVRVGALCAMAGQSAAAGSAILGKGVHCGGQSGIAEHTNIGDGARIFGQAGVIEDVPQASMMAGTPAMPARDFFKFIKMLKSMT